MDVDGAENCKAPPKGGKDAVSNEKRVKGQYFTRGNAFESGLFKLWIDGIEGFGSKELLEPFAGGNHIPKSIKELGFANKWRCFDVVVQRASAVDGLAVEQRDTIADFPDGFSVAITNPPYLAKNSAVRRGLAFPPTAYDDLYKLALEKMLAKVGHVAAIVPESFVTQGLFESRLFGIVSLSGRHFEDTEHPVCLALFVPADKAGKDYQIWRDDEPLGLSKALKSARPAPASRVKWRFNDPAGQVGIRCVDGTKGPSISFVNGSEIPSSEIKHTSRALTRVSVDGAELSSADLERLLNEAQTILNAYRKSTQDVEMTSFKGLRDDGRYRRRLDFALARAVLDEACEKLKISTNRSPNKV